MELKQIPADDILSIALSRFDKLFSFDNYSHEFAVLRGHWHPDKNNNGKAKDVFQHIYLLHEKAEEAIAHSTWPGRAEIKWRSADSTLSLEYLKAHPFELGVMYVARKHVLWLLKKEHEELFDNAVRRIEGLNYAGDEMRDQFAKLMPKIVRITKCPEHLSILMSKTPDVHSLRDVLNNLGSFDPKHAAWVVSRLQNIAAYFEYTQVSHQALSVDTLFVSPKYHSILVLGGWWYAAPIGSTVRKVPAQLLPLLPNALRTEKKAIVKTDQSLLRAVASTLLGDASGVATNLHHVKDLPVPFLRYLQGPSSDSAYKGYGNWMKVLKESFGERKFVELAVSDDDIYL